jgi:predicted dehydrogenase
LGRWGRNLVNAVQGKSEKLRFVQCVVRQPEAAREYAVEKGLELKTDFDYMLRDERIQAVVLATPHSVARATDHRCGRSGEGRVLREATRAHCG